MPSCVCNLVQRRSLHAQIMLTAARLNLLHGSYQGIINVCAKLYHALATVEAALTLCMPATAEVDQHQAKLVALGEMPTKRQNGSGHDLRKLCLEVTTRPSDNASLWQQLLAMCHSHGFKCEVWDQECCHLARFRGFSGVAWLPGSSGSVVICRHRTGRLGHCKCICQWIRWFRCQCGRYLHGEMAVVFSAMARISKR